MTRTQKRAYILWQGKLLLWAHHGRRSNPPGIPQCLSTYFPCNDASQTNRMLNIWANNTLRQLDIL